MVGSVNNLLEEITTAGSHPMPVLGNQIPADTPTTVATAAGGVVKDSSTSSAAVSFTGMKEGELWEFEIFDKTTPATATPANVTYRPYDGSNAAVTTDAVHRSTQPIQRRIRHGQVGYSFKPISGDVTITGVRLL